MLLFYSGTLNTFIMIVLAIINLFTLGLGFYGVNKRKFKPLLLATVVIILTILISMLWLKITPIVKAVNGSLIFLYVLLIINTIYIKIKNNY